MTNKICFKCGGEQPLSEFYKHSQMADGYLGKCKTCTKLDQRKREQNFTPEELVKERARHREKSRKYRDDGRAIPYKKQSVPKTKEALAADLVGRAVRAKKLTRKPCVVCGSDKAQGHHEDYDKPLEVEWLCIRHHHDRHIHMRDQEILGKPVLAFPDWLQAMSTNC